MRRSRVLLTAAAAVLLVGNLAASSAGAFGVRPALLSSPNPAGVLTTLLQTGPLDQSHPFFQSLGTNGRACVTCHDPANGWSLSAAAAQARFDATGGLDPLFRPNDGANSPQQDVSTPEARTAAYSLLRSRGVFRIGLPMPSNAEFTLEAVDDPYGYAGPSELSLYRRPLPATNLRFASSVMWDGRETNSGNTLPESLASQARTAVMGHAQAAANPSADQLNQIVDFEMGLVTAQASDRVAGKLDGWGARGGPLWLARQPYYPGINTPDDTDPRGKEFDPSVFRLFHLWGGGLAASGTKAARQAIARGEAIFNTHQNAVSGVRGLNDFFGQPSMVVSCSTCHNTPGSGGMSLPLEMDIGVSNPARRTPDVPLYTFRNAATGEELSTTDPGRALVTGKWSDMDRFKVPLLRGLAARAPYFHDGSAATLEDVVQFYDDRFGLHLGSQQKSDLVAFLRSL